MKKDFFVKLIFYIFIGAYGVVIDLSVFNFFFNLPIIDSSIRDHIVSTLGFGLFATLAAILGGISGFLNNFLMNEFLVYEIEGRRRTIVRRFLKYLATVSFGTFFIGKVIIFNFCLSALHLGPSTSNLISIGLSTLLNYPINYFWTWGDLSLRKAANVLKKS